MTLISKNANNWVDRGAPPNAAMRLTLGHFFGRLDTADGPWLEDHVLAIIGVVEASGTEAEVTRYLKNVVAQVGYPTREPLGARAAAAALWHMAKVAQVRDFAERLLRGDVPPSAATGEKLSDWVASKLLSPEELEEFERTRAREGEGSGGN